LLTGALFDSVRQHFTLFGPLYVPVFPQALRDGPMLFRRHLESHGIFPSATGRALNIAAVDKQVSSIGRPSSCDDLFGSPVNAARYDQLVTFAPPYATVGLLHPEHERPECREFAGWDEVYEVHSVVKMDTRKVVHLHYALVLFIGLRRCDQQRQHST
jgi:hypothetical protein